jgi:hypothetical protein
MISHYNLRTAMGKSVRYFVSATENVFEVHKNEMDL